MEVLEQIFALVLAAALGGAVGYQREALDRPAGLRTHMLVSVAAALMAMLGTVITGDMVDQTRIAAGVVTGIGFIGAGTIIRQGSAVRGITTAASIFAVAGIGLAVGVGFYVGAIAGTVIVFLILSYGKKVESHFIPHTTIKQIAIRASNESNLMGQLEEVFRRNGGSIRKVTADETDGGQEVTVIIELRLAASSDPSHLLREIGEVPIVSESAWRD